MVRRVTAAVVAAAVIPAAAASAATIQLQAPREIDRAEKFRVVTSGQAKPRREYFVSVLYQDDSQGRCTRKLEKAVTKKHYKVHYLRKVVTAGEGGFALTSRKLVGGEKKTSGRFCGYLTNEAGTKNKGRAARRVAFT